jgi:hypothetical protein
MLNIVPVMCLIWLRALAVAGELENVTSHSCILYFVRFIALLLVVFGLTAEQALEEFSELSTNVLDFQGDAPARTTVLRSHINSLLLKYGIEKEMLLVDSDSRSNGSKW